MHIFPKSLTVFRTSLFLKDASMSPFWYLTGRPRSFSPSSVREASRSPLAYNGVLSTIPLGRKDFAATKNTEQPWLNTVGLMMTDVDRRITQTVAVALGLLWERNLDFREKLQ